jgi:hypothetical protein
MLRVSAHQLQSPHEAKDAANVILSLALAFELYVANTSSM